jgi:hypothetical protein
MELETGVNIMKCFGSKGWAYYLIHAHGSNQNRAWILGPKELDGEISNCVVLEHARDYFPLSECLSVGIHRLACASSACDIAVTGGRQDFFGCCFPLVGICSQDWTSAFQSIEVDLLLVTAIVLGVATGL